MSCILRNHGRRLKKLPTMTECATAAPANLVEEAIEFASNINPENRACSDRLCKIQCETSLPNSQVFNDW